MAATAVLYPQATGGRADIDITPPSFEYTPHTTGLPSSGLPRSPDTARPRESPTPDQMSATPKAQSTGTRDLGFTAAALSSGLAFNQASSSSWLGLPHPASSIPLFQPKRKPPRSFRIPLIPFRAQSSPRLPEVPSCELSADAPSTDDPLDSKASPHITITSPTPEEALMDQLPLPLEIPDSGLPAFPLLGSPKDVNAWRPESPVRRHTWGTGATGLLPPPLEPTARVGLMTGSIPARPRSAPSVSTRPALVRLRTSVASIVRTQPKYSAEIQEEMQSLVVSPRSPSWMTHWDGNVAVGGARGDEDDDEAEKAKVNKVPIGDYTLIPQHCALC